MNKEFKQSKQSNKDRNIYQNAATVLNVFSLCV